MNKIYNYFVTASKYKGKYYYFVEKFYYNDNIAQLIEQKHLELVLWCATKKEAEEIRDHYEQRAMETNREFLFG